MLISIIPEDIEMEITDKIRIVPILSYDEIKKFKKEFRNLDGYAYPSMQVTARLNIKTGKKTPIEGTSRPAFLWRLPSSHKIVGLQDNSENRNNSGKFILFFLSFVYGTELRYGDWWREGRVRIPDKKIFEIREVILNKITKKAFEYWNNLNQSNKDILSNSVFFLNRSKSHELEYMRYISSYIAVDCLWRVGVETGLWKEKVNGRNVPHHERIKLMCDALGIPIPNDDLLLKIKNVRNHLFHEGRWGKIDPLESTEISQFYQILNLEQLVERILPRIMKLEPYYTKTPWWLIRSWQDWK